MLQGGRGRERNTINGCAAESFGNRKCGINR